ncbi:replicative DNA helicase [Dongia soli]|uniref:Replicative DNA helicase n=1 Tax=Dongia soli TaxID=600628 RepID=A0ABU5ECX9_9PROT|nr:replicative DNA helicase [Dongia soli]MDY0884036.1 replicative DNA helicase [Dongia soli]
MESNAPLANVTRLRNQADASSDVLTQRTPPHNTEAEQALLGAILANNQVFDKVNEFLRPEHFADALHGRIYEAIAKLVQRGQIANPVTLKNLFDQDGALAEIGGAQYLVQLAQAVVSIINAEDYGKAVFDLYLRRQLIGLGTDVVNDAYIHDPDVTAVNLIEGAEMKLFNLAESGQTEGGPKRFDTVVKSALEMAELAFKRDSQLTGVPTGLDDLDKKLGGLQPSDLIILAGRPSMGKTSLATNMGYNAAKREKSAEPGDTFRVAFFSMEMSAEQLAHRIMADESGVSSDRIRRGEVTDDEFPRIVEAAQTMSSRKFFIDDTPALTVPALRTRARRLKRQYGLDLIIIDYLQLMRSASAKGGENRVQEISEITRGLKAIAKELNVPVVALSQLSRAVENREDKRPQLADLRESGSIEQDADVVMFVFREEYYHERKKPSDHDTDKLQQWMQEAERLHNKAELILAKQRHGPIGTVMLHFEGTVTRFSNLILDDHLPAHH